MKHILFLFFMKVIFFLSGVIGLVFLIYYNNMMHTYNVKSVSRSIHHGVTSKYIRYFRCITRATAEPRSVREGRQYLSLDFNKNN